MIKQRQNRVPPISRFVMFLNGIVKRKAEIAARALTGKTQKLTPTQLRRCLVAFAVIGVLFNVTIIITAFENHPAAVITPPIVSSNNRPLLKMTQQQILNKNGQKNYEQVIQLENYLDSLQKTEEGKKQFENFIAQHPQFMDSIQLFKRLYSSR